MHTHCPDCGEPLSARRGVVPLTATAYCEHCNWCEVIDGGRGVDAKEDWANRYAQNTDRQGGDDDE